MIITTPNGKTFTTGMRIFAGLIAFILLPFIPFSLPFILIGILMLFAKDVSEVDTEAFTFRTANSIMGLKLGKWEPLDDFGDITIMKRKKGKASVSHQTMQSNILVNNTYEVVLLNSNHRKKKVVYSGLNEAFAINLRNKIADALHLNKVAYNPQLSSKTLARRNR
ncbi:MAG: hypothetical protein EP346_09065 [Bacteroidetes bacterium]|nr:MAG: hypothetical protein EP346_09065 [Bacteroidota bacterium]